MMQMRNQKIIYCSCCGSEGANKGPFRGCPMWPISKMWQFCEWIITFWENDHVITCGWEICFWGKVTPSLLFSSESKRIEKMVHGVKFQCPVLLLGSLLAFTLALTEEQVEMWFPLLCKAYSPIVSFQMSRKIAFLQCVISNVYSKNLDQSMYHTVCTLSTVYFQMCSQSACIRRCLITLAALIWLFSTVHLQMCL